jgi:hypothetical protein
LRLRRSSERTDFLRDVTVANLLDPLSEKEFVTQLAYERPLQVTAKFEAGGISLPVVTDAHEATIMKFVETVQRERCIVTEYRIVSHDSLHDS